MKTTLKLLLATLTLTLAATTQAAVETYKIDPAHSSVGFKIRHFFTQVPGSFTRYEGTITVDRDQLEKSTVETTIEAASIDTREAKRDQHLRSDDFFAVAQHPSLTFKSRQWKRTGEDTFDVTGDLTIKGVTKEVVLQVKSLGFGPGANGAMLSGWHATTTINRNDFGITGFAKMLGAEIPITIDVEAKLAK